MRFSLLTVLLLLPALAGATEISVGGVALRVPNPTGFALVTPEMAPLYELQKQFVAATNEEFAVFIPEEHVAAARAGQVPALPRRFTVQTAKHLVNASVSTADFARLKTMLKSQNEELVKKLMQEAPELMKQVGNGVNRELNTDLAFSVAQMIPFPFHEESDRSLAHTALVKYQIQDGAGAAVPFVTSVTSTFVHVKGKVLFLYTYAEEDAVAWSQQVSREWVAQVVQANPPDAEAAAREARAPILGIDWAGVQRQALFGGAVGALVGGMIGLVRLLKRRRPE